MQNLAVCLHINAVSTGAVRNDPLKCYPERVGWLPNNRRIRESATFLPARAFYLAEAARVSNILLIAILEHLLRRLRVSLAAATLRC